MATTENVRPDSTLLQQSKSSELSHSQQKNESLTSPTDSEVLGSPPRIEHAVTTPTTLRRFQPLRFVFGLTLTTIGISMILFVAIRVFDSHYFSGRFAMTLVALVILCGVIMLGGGFGLMMTASADFDDGEFERLLNSGNIANTEIESMVPTPDQRPNRTPRRAA